MPNQSKFIVSGSITKLPSDAAGKILVSGSHGGNLPGIMAVQAGLKGVILNDAGIGLDNAGIAGLEVCRRAGMPAATVDFSSCRIGDGQDMLQRGRISFFNNLAKEAGVSKGQACQDAADCLADASVLLKELDLPVHENRTEIEMPEGQRGVVLADSASMIGREDIGKIVVTGSHGGLIDNNPAFAVKADVFAAFYNDAGLGKDDWGASRLPILDKRNIAGMTVDCMSCWIGDASSAYENGILSRTNHRAEALGLKPGLAVKQAVEILSQASSSEM